jgi:hypothetical protein
VRFEFARVEGKESWSWPGGRNFDVDHPSQVLEDGMSGSGEFSAYARAVFLNQASMLSLEGGEGEEFVIRYQVPVFASGFTVTSRPK